MRHALLALVMAVATASPTLAQAPEPFWPGAQYDPKIPTLEQVVGHALRRPHHDAGADGRLPARAGAGRAGAHASHRIRPHLGRAAVVAVRGRQPRAHGPARPGEGRHQAPGRPAPAGPGRRRPARRRRCRSSSGWCTACTATRSARATPRCSRPITCWPRAATPASTRCCATRSCSSTRCRIPTAGPGSSSRTCRARRPSPTRRPTTPSTTSRGRAGEPTTTSST